MTTHNGIPESPVVHGAGPQASAADLRDFLDRFRTKDPQELLGVSDTGGLFGPMVIATIATGVIFAALTIVPYVLSKNAPANANAEKPAEKVEPAKVETPKPDATAKVPATTTPNSKGKAEPTAKVDASPGTPPAKGPDILQKLGENETKTASPKVNPLDKKNDDLLNDLIK